MLKLTQRRAFVECLSCLKCYDTPENNYFFLLQSSLSEIITSNQLATSAGPVCIRIIWKVITVSPLKRVIAKENSAPTKRGLDGSSSP